MPELPEVELCAEKLRAWAVGRTILGVRAQDGPPLRGDTTPAVLSAALVGHKITAVDRHGKQLALRTSGGSALLVHLGMTGDWARGHEGARLVLELDDGPLSMRDVRRLGRVRVVPSDGVESAREWAELGPDALDEVGKKGRLARCLSATKLPIKVALMDQSKVAGVGNIYASEACFVARIDPRREARTLATEDFDRLGKAITAAMRKTLRQGRRDPDFVYLSEGGENRFEVYGREGGPCPRCETEIVRFEQAGRSTFACPACQLETRRRRARTGARGRTEKKAVRRR